ncbi:MAG: ChaN family lipoprotein [Longimicrobiales bacterium]|nr:ChaN family lipoprotein [Longimicrobiales bacterium]
MKHPVPVFALMVLLVLSPVVAHLETASAQQDAAAQIPDYTNHFRVFTGEGEPASLEDIVQAMNGVDAVLVGEIHTDPIGHWIETELFRKALALAGVGEEAGALRSVALSLEMFERDVQGIVDEYLRDLITEDQFTASARPWEFYDSDYRPMVELAKAAGVPVLAANAPRRYVNRVSRLGPGALGELSPRARSTLPPLPYPPPTDAYRAEWNALMAGMVMEQQCPAPEKAGGQEEDAPDAPPADDPPHGPPVGMATHAGSFMENGLQAQTLWDASMAHAITTFLEMNPGALVLHMVGGFHVMNHTGTPEKVQFYRPGTRSLVVHMDIADDFNVFDVKEHAGRGDFVILTDKSLDLNYDRNCREDGGGA